MTYAGRAMTTPDQHSADQPERTADDVRLSRADRRRERIRAELQRNREGGHRVPTWVLAAFLAVLLLGWAYLIVTR